MSASSVRRLKNHGPDSGNVSAAKSIKTLTPHSQKVSSSDVLKKASVGKENFGSSSKIPVVSAQNPVIRSMPRIEKPSSLTKLASSDGESKTRLSASSVPRGRSSSPSDMTRFLSDLKKIQGPSRAAVEVNGRSLSRGRKVGTNEDCILKEKSIRDSSVKRSNNGIRGARGGKDSVNIPGSLTKKKEIVPYGESWSKLDESRKLSFSKGVEILENCKKEVSLISNLNSSSRNKVNGELEMFANHNDIKVIEDSHKTKEISHLSSTSIDWVENGGGTSMKKMEEKSSSVPKTLASIKEKRLSDVGANGRVGVKNTSKLHERLAYLESKVKKIASDIKQTKELLDTNNPDESKVILSDIQDKILGIEEAIGRVESNSAGDIISLKTVQTNKSGNVKDVIKGLNTQELEARLFPHDRLLRDRSLKVSLGTTTELSTESKIEDKGMGSIIAMEFLDSLHKDLGKVTTKNEVEEMDCASSSEVHTSSTFNENHDGEINFTTNETLDEFDDKENGQLLMDEEIEDTCHDQLNEIGHKTSTGGWFVSEGEAVLLAHDDGSCTFYDVVNCETKAEFKPPSGVSSNLWRDCWIMRATDADGCSGRYVVAASAGNTTDSGFCSWDFYTKDVRAFHIEDDNPTLRTVLAPLPNNSVYKRNALSTILAVENMQWWYKPCGHLIVSTATCQQGVKIFDIRDGEQMVKWQVQKHILAMDYSSPLQWRNRGKVVIAEADAISLWDVNSLSPQALQSVSLSGKKMSAFHVNNTDAELGGGVRQRVSSSEAEGNDGVYCTTDSINILDFRQPSGVGLKIPKLNVDAHSVFSRGDSVYLGCTSLKAQKQPSQVQQFSIRKQKLISTFPLPESKAHSHYTAITQVWGNSNVVMGVCGLGLFVFDAVKDEGGFMQSVYSEYDMTRKVRETIGSDDLYSPSFDYLGSRALLISRDRPALWKHLS